MRRFTLLAFAMVSGMAAAAPKANLDKGKQIATAVYASCHAADGDSGIAVYPKLSAQRATYIYGQTKAIKGGKRATGASDVMKPMVMNLSEQDMHNVAAYYSKQQSKSGETSLKEEPELGAKVYRGSTVDKKVPACISCHRPSGARIPGSGTDIAAYPRLGG